MNGNWVRFKDMANLPMCEWVWVCVCVCLYHSMCAAITVYEAFYTPSKYLISYCIEVWIFSLHLPIRFGISLTLALFVYQSESCKIHMEQWLGIHLAESDETNRIDFVVTDKWMLSIHECSLVKSVFRFVCVLVSLAFSLFLLFCAASHSLSLHSVMDDHASHALQNVWHVDW